MSTFPILAAARQRVLVLDGAMGTNIHARNLRAADYDGHDNCNEILVETRPDVIGDIHRAFLAVGCDGVLTNTFGANRIVLGEFGLAERTRELNCRAAGIAREACADFARPDKPRFVLGSMGPGTRLPSLGQITWDELVESYRQQAAGLLEGGVEALLIETCQDILQTKAAVVGATDAMTATGYAAPIFCTVTIESTGTMLVGTELAAALVALEAYEQVVGVGLNCATGPQEMSEHVRYLSGHSERLLIVQPNAGLPQLVDGQARYPLTPAELARWLTEFAEVDGVNFVGGCCGTTPAHLAAVVRAIGERAPRVRQLVGEPSVSSLYHAVPIRQDTDCLAIGERTNANGSKRFRELLAAGDLDGMVAMAREQVHEGSHLLDVCTARVGCDEVRDMSAVVRRFVTDVPAPLVIDSTEAEVIEAALKLTGGKCIINSINLEGGEEKLNQVCRLAKRHGAALIALTIDEEGMARTCARKIAIARRIYELATRRHGVRPEDLIFDALTFTVCTGNSEDRRLAAETLDALPLIKEQCPGSYTLLGVSNVSFGVKPAVRRVLNSVFLHHARARGLDAAILHASGIVPLFKVEERQRRLAEDLLLDRRREGYDPLTTLLNLAAEESAAAPRTVPRPAQVEERLKRRIIDGDRAGLEEDLEEALLTYRPLDIINEILLDGMKTVGDLFGAGQMQLPFVLQSAETMKAAVRYLEDYLDQAEQPGSRGTLVLATVAGDVHDIGKNLVDIILSNNGYTVHNLGIKQPISAMIDAFEKQGADALGMSGLLVKSTLVMRDNLLALNERGLTPPVILGGAALTRKYVEEDLRSLYRGPLYYAKDAFAGLQLMQQFAVEKAARPAAAMGMARVESVPVAIEVGAEAAAGARAAGGSLHAQAQVAAAPDAGGAERPARPVSPPAPVASAGAVSCVAPQSDISRDEPVPEPPFWGARVIERIEPQAAAALLNENMLFQVQWGYRKGGRSSADFARYVNAEVRPILRRLLETCAREDTLRLQAIYGFWPAQADGDRLLIYDAQDRGRVLVAFDFPRMGKPPYWCLSDFFHPVGSGTIDVAAFSIVTAGRRVSEVAQEWLRADRYQDYLHLHGLGVEITEALAEYVHKQIRVEWDIAGNDARDKQELFKQRYQGSRYSFGYPACPRLEDQVKLWPLLEPQRIGVTLTETFQLEPEQTTTALIVHHRQAKYFNVR
ncbi:MAG TPA: methionine synthase [Phycisphaerae bacterium]|nr:methionine synthase [Phycisphaerae bacterium]HNU46043.1 methionine synthase [Phycisphaerae bacterium]